MNKGQQLADRLESITKYLPSDEGWYHFVRDNKHYLKANGVKRSYMPEALVKYRYRPDEFVAHECRLDPSATWIFLFVNDIRDPAEFNESRTNMIIVTKTLVEQLYQMYMTSENKNVT